MVNPLAQELNKQIARGNPRLFEALSGFGKALYYPKGILTQTAESKEKAHRHNATIGIAKSGGKPLFIASIMDHFRGMDPADVLPYAPSFGLDSLRHAWQDKLFADNQSLNGKRISLPVVTSGITHGLSLVGDLFVDSGDTVVIPDKAWGNYLMIYNVRYRANIAKYRLLSPSGGLDMCSFRQTVLAAAQRGKVIVVLNFPNNPTGYSPTVGEAEAIRNVLREAADTPCDVVAICDDAYFGLVYDNQVLEESLFGLLAGAHPRIFPVKLDGATKEDFVWGFRTGFITLSALSKTDDLHSCLEKKCAGAIRGGISNCPMPSQAILMKAMKSPEYESQLAEARGILRKRTHEVSRLMRQEKYRPAWVPYPFNSGYFMCIRLKHINAEEFRRRLLNRYGVGVIAVSETDIRIAFSCIEADELEELFDIMLRCAIEMSTGSKEGG